MKKPNLCRFLLSVSAITVCLGLYSVAYAARHKPAKQAVVEAIPTAQESRIVRYTYSPDVIFRIFSQPTLHTHIELGADEGLKETPVAGDTSQWRISGGPRNLFVKPIRNGIDTSLTVVTNKRTYQFQLIASKQNQKIYQKVSFDYPEREAEIQLLKDFETAKVIAEQTRLKEQVVSESIQPDQLDFSFDISGETSFKPKTVYTDGIFTFIRLPNSQDNPAVFILDEDDNPSLINYRVKHNLIIVERVAKRILLKLGEAETKITYNGAIQ